MTEQQQLEQKTPETPGFYRHELLPRILIVAEEALTGGALITAVGVSLFIQHTLSHLVSPEHVLYSNFVVEVMATRTLVALLRVGK